MKYSTPIILALSVIASSAQADPETTIIDVQQHAEPNNIMDPDHSWEKQIIGGSNAKENEFPYFASFNNCGGTLIAPDAVLFAAHCKDAEGKQVLINSHRRGKKDKDTEVRFCDQWEEHDGWNGPARKHNDFALCKLDEPVYINSQIKLKWNDDPEYEVKGDLIVMGYGETENSNSVSETLKHTTVQAYSDAICKSGEYLAGMYHESMMCAGVEEGGRDACQGDSGGPLVKRTLQGNTITDTIVGVSSWGIGCGSPKSPGVYAKVSHAKDWIRTTVCQDFQSVADWCDCDEDWCGDGPTPASANVCGDDEVAFEVEVNTDKWAEETSWFLKERKFGKLKIAAGSYFISENKNVHTICLKKQMCYKFDITDVVGDGMCSGGNCRSYSFGVAGKDRYFEFADLFEHKKNRFCISDVGDAVRRWPPKNPNPNPNKKARRQNRKNKKKNNLRHRE